MGSGLTHALAHGSVGGLHGHGRSILHSFGHYRHFYDLGLAYHFGHRSYYPYPYFYHHAFYTPYYYPYWDTGFFFGAHIGYPFYTNYVTVVDPYPVYTSYYAPAVIERRVYLQQEPVVVSESDEYVAADDAEAVEVEPGSYTYRTRGGYIYQPPTETQEDVADVDVVQPDGAQHADVAPQTEPAQQGPAVQGSPSEERPTEPTEKQVRDLAEEFSRSLIAGQNAFRAGDYAAARAKFAAALAVMPDNVEAKLSYTQACFALKDYSVAAAALREAAQTWPELAKAQIDLTKPYGRSDDFTQQLKALGTYVLSNPDDANARLLLGYQYYFSGRKSAAAAEFRAVLDLRPEDQTAKLFLDARRGK